MKSTSMRNVRSTCESMAQHTSPSSFPRLGGADEYQPSRWFCPSGRQLLPWDYFRLARHPDTITKCLYASVVSRAVLFGEVDATQQTLEAGVGTKWVESRIHFQVASVRDKPLRELRRPVHSGRGLDKSARIGKTTQIMFLNDPSTRRESSELRRGDPQGLVRERARQARSRPVPPKARCLFGSARVLLGISSFVRTTCRFPNTAPGIWGRAQELFGVV